MSRGFIMFIFRMYNMNLTSDTPLLDLLFIGIALGCAVIAYERRFN